MNEFVAAASQPALEERKPAQYSVDTLDRLGGVTTHVIDAYDVRRVDGMFLFVGRVESTFLTSESILSITTAAINATGDHRE